MSTSENTSFSWWRSARIGMMLVLGTVVVLACLMHSALAQSGQPTAPGKPAGPAPPLTTAAAPPPAPGLMAEVPSNPGLVPGAKILETHQGWMVACLADPAQPCVVAHVLYDPFTRKMLAALEGTVADHGLVLEIIVAHTVALSGHIRVRVDNAVFKRGLRIRRCSALGCSFFLEARTPQAMATLRNGHQLQLELPQEKGAALTVSVSLAGLAQAHDGLLKAAAAPRSP